MRYIAGENRDQITFLPDCIEDYIGGDNPVRVIDAFVNSLNMDELGFTHSTLKETGRPPYDPKDLLKLYIYGYFNKIRSSRKLMQECGRNVEVFYLLNRLQPDFRTIADFRKNNPKAIRKVFRAFVKLCIKLKLYQRELIAIDGSKFRAQNSDKNCYNAEVLEKKIANIQKNIDEYLNRIDTIDKEETLSNEATPEQIREVIKELHDRKGKYMQYLNELKQSGETQFLTTDPDARRMHSKDGFHCCYNVQTAVDGGSHMIAEYEVTNKTDVGHLNTVSEKAKEILEVSVITAAADKGYDSRKDILDCLPALWDIY